MVRVLVLLCILDASKCVFSFTTLNVRFLISRNEVLPTAVGPTAVYKVLCALERNINCGHCGQQDCVF